MPTAIPFALSRISRNCQPDVPIELVASIYLVTATQLAAIDAGTALKRLDYIRLNAPGTLLEEAALRRGLIIAARLGDKDKVRLLARNYLQRFAFSPYSEDFFRQLVDALMEIKDKISNEEIEEIASLAWPGARLPFLSAHSTRCDRERQSAAGTLYFRTGRCTCPVP